MEEKTTSPEEGAQAEQKEKRAAYMRAQVKRYYQRHKEEIKARRKARRNKETERRYYEANKAKILARNKNYIQQNKERRRQIARAYYLRTKAKKAAQVEPAPAGGHGAQLV